MFRFQALTPAAALLAVFGSALHADGNALILGNARYATLGPLSGTVDVIDPSEPLRAAGLTVEVATDAERAGLAAAFGAFVSALQPGEGPAIAILSGVFMHGDNGAYLLPLEATEPSAAKVLTEALPLDAVLAVLAQAPGEALLVLGERGSGDAPGPLIRDGIGMLDVPQGVTVIRGRIDDVASFVAEDLVVAGAQIVPAARARGLTIEGFAPDSLVLLPEDAPAPAPAAPAPVAEADPAPEPVPSPVVAAEPEPEPEPVAEAEQTAEPMPEPETTPVAEAEPQPEPAEEETVAANPEPEAAPEPLTDAEAWEIARDADTLNGYRSYLSDFPEGQFAPAASQRVAALEQAQDPFRGQRLAESALGLSRDSRREVQQNLTDLGYDTRGVDGIFGRATRAAIVAWQNATNRTPSSFLDDAQIREIAAQVRRQAEQREAEERRAWRAVAGSSNAAGLRRYLEDYPEGRFADEARAQIAALSRQRSVSRLSPDERRWAAAQAAGTIAAYQRYLIENPEGAFQREAERRIIRMSQ